MIACLRKVLFSQVMAIRSQSVGFRCYHMTGLASVSLFSIFIPSPARLLAQSKELLSEHELICPLQCNHEPLRDQLEKIKRSVRPKCLVEKIVVSIYKAGHSLRLVYRSVYISILFSPTVLTCWFLFFSCLQGWWYRLLVKTLKIGGPSFMKLGQWAATRPDILPLELCKQLSTLHSTTPCYNYSLMKTVIEKELGQDLIDVFDWIDETPIGSGCIAQVYKACLRDSNQIIAIKVKRPGVDALFTYDLQLINSFAYFISFIPFTEYIAPIETARLFTTTMKEQLDFKVEAINLVRFRENFRDDDQFAFPEPYLNLTTSSLLIESYEEGIPLSTLLTHPTSYNHSIAHLGILGFLHMLLVDNFLHADLHPGNILVRQRVPCKVPLTKSICHRSFGLQESHPQLVFLDTGLVNILEESQKRNFIDIFIALSNGNGYQAGKLLIDRAPQPSPPVIDPEGFAMEIKELVDMNMDNGVFNLSKLEIANALSKMLSSSLKHHVTIDSRFINLFMSVIILEGVGRQLDKNLNIISAALPIMNYSIPEYGQAARHAIFGSKFARKSLYISIRSFLKNDWNVLRQRFSRKTKEPEEYVEDYFKMEEGVDERGSMLVSLYDRIKKNQSTK